MSFAADVKKWAKKAKLKQRTVIGFVRLNLSNKILLKTPVDTGTARESWLPSIGTPNTKGGKSSQIGIMNTAFSSTDKTYYLTNNLPYIGVLEYGGYPNPVKRGSYLKTGQQKGNYTGPGWFKFSKGGFSKQAPQGMVRVTVAEFQAVVGEAVRVA